MATTRLKTTKAPSICLAERMKLNSLQKIKNLLCSFFSRHFIPEPSLCHFYTCYHKQVPIDNTTTTTTTPAPPPTPPPTPSPTPPHTGFYFILAMAFIGLFIFACSSFAIYCVVKQYFWQRSNREMQRSSLSSPSETTPIIRSRHLSISSPLEIDQNQAQYAQASEMVTFMPARKYNFRRRPNEQAGASSLGATASLNYKPVTLIKDLEPFLPDFQPQNNDQWRCVLFLQRLQILVSCQTLKVDKAQKALHEHGRALTEMSADPNSASCK